LARDLNAAACRAKLLAAACALAAGACLAATTEPPLADPTRPPDPITAVTATTGAASAVAAPTVWPRLQSVRLSASGGDSALIDGRMVRVGERVGTTTLVAIGTQSVLLRGPGFSQQIALLPGTFKTASTTAPPTHVPAATTGPAR
jgi:MSHA biogenesis protein MshK